MHGTDAAVILASTSYHPSIFILLPAVVPSSTVLTASLQLPGVPLTHSISQFCDHGGMAAFSVTRVTINHRGITFLTCTRSLATRSSGFFHPNTTNIIRAPALWRYFSTGCCVSGGCVNGDRCCSSLVLPPLYSASSVVPPSVNGDRCCSSLVLPPLYSASSVVPPSTFYVLFRPSNLVGAIHQHPPSRIKAPLDQLHANLRSTHVLFPQFTGFRVSLQSLEYW
jgi:hypothetical protein